MNMNMSMKTLVLKDKVLSYSPTLKGSSVLSNELVNLMEENEQLHEKRLSLLYGVNVHKKQVSIEVWDEYGLTPGGECLHIRGHYTLTPAPMRAVDLETSPGFGTGSSNIMYLVDLLKKNCVQLKEKLDNMRVIVDEMQDNNLYLPDMLHDMYLNCEKLYCGIQFDIGFITNIVVVSG